MSFVPWLSVGFALAICVGPVLLLRRPGAASGPNQPTPPAIVRNAWIAYALRLSLFVPLFALGAAGDMWPAIVGAVAFGAGVSLLNVLRRLSVGFGGDPRPATLHAWLAQVCGGAASVRLATAACTVVALLGLAGAEATVLVVLLTPLLGEGIGLPAFALLMAVAGLVALWAGLGGVRYAAQALLGAIFVGVFGSTAFLLYLNASDLRPLPPHGAFALIVLMACSVAVLIYRQTKYIETPHLVEPDESPRWRRTFGRQVRLLQRFTNVAISVIAVTGIVIAGMAVYVLGPAGIAHDGLSALGTWPKMPAVGLTAIALLALIYPLVDGVSWQNGEALADAAGAETNPALAFRPIRLVAVETATLGVFVAGFGAMATLSTDLPPDSLGITDFVGQLIVFQHGITDAALTLLLVGCFAMAMATMSTAIGTAVIVLRLDILPAMRPVASEAGSMGSADRVAAVAASGVAVALAVVWIVSGAVVAGLVDGRFYALALVFVCLQVSLLPLLLARLCGIALPGAGWALTMLGGSAAAALVCIAAYGATANAFWLWLAVPACVVSGLVVLATTAFRARTFPPR